MGDGGYSPDLVPRLCHIVRWSDFNGYGFNLHAEKGKAGQFIGKVDEGSPAEAAGLKAGDRIVEVNGTNIGNENHQQVVGRIKAGGEETRLLVVDPETDHHYKEQKKVVRGDLPEVKFLTAAREDDHDEREEPQIIEDTTLVTEATNGTEAEPEPEPEPEPVLESAPEVRSVAEEGGQQVARLCNLCKWADFDGYGFNLHAEKDKPGQYIGLVDPDSPAELGGMREGDRIVEVNGENIEAYTHTVVIQKIKSGGDRVAMLVVDRAADQHFKARGQTISSSMVNVLVITTPPRPAVEDTPLQHQEHLQVAAFHTNIDVAEGPTGEEVDLAAQEVSAAYYSEDRTREVDLAAQEVEAAYRTDTTFAEDGPGQEVGFAAQEIEAAYYFNTAPAEDRTSGPEEEGLAADDVPAPVWQLDTDTGLPEPSIDLSDTEETTERVTAVVTESLESAPVAEASETFANGTEEVAAGVAAVAVTEEEEVVVAAPAPQEQEEEEEGRVVGGVEYHPYEELVITPSSPPEPTTTVSYQEDLGTASNGINGGAVVEAQAEAVAVKTSDSMVASSRTVSGDDNLNLNLSAAEMKERLKSRKKQDPRQSKTSFETKYKMFEKM